MEGSAHCFISTGQYNVMIELKSLEASKHTHTHKHTRTNHTLLNFLKTIVISPRLFGPDDEQNEETDSDGTIVTTPAQPFPSYAATAALPAPGPVTATLTG